MIQDRDPGDETDERLVHVRVREDEPPIVAEAS